MIQFSFNHSEHGDTIVLFGAQGARVVPDSHANYANIKAALLDPHVVDVDEQRLYALADAATTVVSKLMRLSERVTIKGDKIFFDGDEMDNRLSKHIIAMVRNDDDNYQGYVQFLENLMANPSKNGRKGLFRFLDRNGLVITEDGCFIGYKGVGSDGKSVTAGAQDVTVTQADGTVDVHKGHIPNPVGATVEMPRSLVDPDRDVACSVGLHVGTHSYAQNWSSGGKFLTVKVNPRDVVEVPNDSGGEKLRASRYTVLEVNEAKTLYGGTSFMENDEPSLSDGPVCPDCGWEMDTEDYCSGCGYGSDYEYADDYAEPVL